VGCLAVIVALVSPRLALALIFLLSDWISVAFEGGWFLPVLGFFILPWTTLVFVLVAGASPGIEPFEVFLLILAFLIDLYSYGKTSAVQQERTG
jgi:hypothetical protein